MLTRPMGCTSLLFVITGTAITYWRFQSKVYNVCNDLMQKALSFNDVAISSVIGNDYSMHFWYMSKDAEKKNKNSDLAKKEWNVIKHKNLLFHTKEMDKEIIMFDDNEIEKLKFYRYKNPVF